MEKSMEGNIPLQMKLVHFFYKTYTRINKLEKKTLSEGLLIL